MLKKQRIVAIKIIIRNVDNVNKICICEWFNKH